MTKYEQFKKREEQFSLEANQLTKTYNWFSTLRVILFLLGLVAFVLLANSRNGVGLAVLVIIFPVLFGAIINKHNNLKARRNKKRKLAAINREEILRFNNDFKEFEEGLEFVEKNHPYAKDMDVFGRNSLYQLLNRTNTPSGAKMLANWLKQKGSHKLILDRQLGVKELADKIDWRQNFQASGVSEKGDQQFANLLEWIDEPNKLESQSVIKGLAYVLPALTLASLLLNIFAGASIYYLVVLGIVSGVVLRKYTAYVTDITEKTHQGYITLKAYASLIVIIENSKFQSVYLKDCQSAFIDRDLSASRTIKSLQHILTFLNARANWFYIFFNFFFLFDIHLLLRAENWKDKLRGDVKTWFDNIGKLEAINSLSGFAYAHEKFAYPSISNDPFELQAESLGHPLIKQDERVSNDFEIHGEGHIALITGSNMSGKSTFLRTIGVNMILAYIGAPVCAQSMILSHMQLFTSMRTEDNLEEHISSFYAELKRIKQLLQLIDSGEPVLFMLDEILKGTNSQDRHAGAEALIRQLSKAKAMGFVSTHDLALGQMSEDYIDNFSFNSEIKDDKIIFNYKLTEGLCQSFNASKLMEQIGIKI